MKKILLFSCLIVLIPIFVVNMFFKKEEINFLYLDDTKIRVKRSDNTIDEVYLEDYVVGVIAGEMPINFEEEALKAQSVASRTYGLKKMIENKNNDYDVVDTIMNQVYLDYEYLKNVWGDKYIDNINKLKNVVKNTKGEYLVYNNEIIDALFFSTSTGYTENSEEVFKNKVPYLRSVESKWDEISPAYKDQKKYLLNEFYHRLNIDYNENLVIEYNKKTSTGRNIELTINGIKFKSSDIVSKLELRSSYFNIIKQNNEVIINTKGYGHGVGMSQYGAQGMALANKKYDEILNYYYKNTKIVKN